MTFAVFQLRGIVFVLRAMLKICVRYESAHVPRCFRCFMLILSGPVELLFLLLLMASLTCLLVKCVMCCKFADVSVYDSVLLVCLMFCRVSELFVKCFCFFFIGDFLFVVKCYTSVGLCM